MAYMTMNESVQHRLEQNGVEIIHHSFDFRTKTDLSIRLPDGRLYEYYDHLFKIPDTLYDGEEISLADTAIPQGLYMETNDAGTCSAAACTTLYDGDNPQYQMESSLIAPAILALIIFLIKLIAVFLVVYILLSKLLHPCGSSAHHQVIDNCIKVITHPNCRTETVDSCWTDPATGETKSRIISSTSAPMEEWIQLAQWAIIGVVAIAGVYVAVKILTRPKSPRYHPPPAYTRAPGIGYVGE